MRRKLGLSLTSGAGPRDSRRETVEKMAERAERASRKWSTCTSPFLPLATWKACEAYFQRRSDVRCVSAGGFDEAERRMLLMGATDIVEAKIGATDWEEEHVSCLAVRGNFKFDAKRRSHRNALGSVLGTGLDRAAIGDIIIPPSIDADLYVIVASDLCEFLGESLSHIGRVPVVARRVALSDIEVPETTEAVFVKTCSSSRLDAVASASFKLSRSKVVESCKRGEIQLNWERCTKPGRELAEGDVITLRGRGRTKIVRLEVNHRGRTVVEFSLFT